jgi:hypothetical protein
MQLTNGSGSREASVGLVRPYQCPCINGGMVSRRSIICGKARSIPISTVAVKSATGFDIWSRARKSLSICPEVDINPERVDKYLLRVVQVDWKRFGGTDISEVQVNIDWEVPGFDATDIPRRSNSPQCRQQPSNTMLNPLCLDNDDTPHVISGFRTRLDSEDISHSAEIELELIGLSDREPGSITDLSNFARLSWANWV